MTVNKMRMYILFVNKKVDQGASYQQVGFEPTVSPVIQLGQLGLTTSLTYW